MENRRSEQSKAKGMQARTIELKIDRTLNSIVSRVSRSGFKKKFRV